MFGYLNLGNPKLIGNTEAQEATNCRVDQGYLEYHKWATSTSPCRECPMGWLDAIASIGNSIPGFGALVWSSETKSITDDPIGLETPTGGPNWFSEWTLPPTSYYPGGTYEYAITLYNEITEEESAPWYKSIVVDGSTRNAAGFNMFPSFPSTYLPYKELYWKVYRKSPGSSEYLRTTLTAYAVADKPPGDTAVGTFDKVSARTATGYNYWDITPDEELGEVCDTVDHTTIVGQSVRSIANFSEKLFVAVGKILYFSKTEMPWAFPGEFQFAFEQNIAGLHPYGETLVVLLESGRSHIIYGDDEDNFVVKAMDADAGIVLNSGRILSGAMLMASKDTTPKIDGVLLFDGTRPVNISGKIRTLFPLPAFATSQTLETFTGSEENRFYILDSLSLNLVNPVVVSVVYDVHAKGFLFGDGAATFRYRTKEFSTPPKARYLRRVFVETYGTVQVQVYLNNTLATDVSFVDTAKTIHEFYVKPWRADSFSFRFTGQPGAIVYAYGVVEPAVEVGD